MPLGIQSPTPPSAEPRHKSLPYASMSKPSTPPAKSANTAINLMLSTNETTMPGDLLVRKSGLPIAKRMAALIRQRSLDMASLITDALKRNAHSKFGPQRGHALIDIPTFRRCLCYAFGEQWTNLAMTTPEFVESYSPYIAREQSENGDALADDRSGDGPAHSSWRIGCC